MEERGVHQQRSSATADQRCKQSKDRSTNQDNGSSTPSCSRPEKFKLVESLCAFNEWPDTAMNLETMQWIGWPKVQPNRAKQIHSVPFFPGSRLSSAAISELNRNQNGRALEKAIIFVG